MRRAGEFRPGRTARRWVAAAFASACACGVALADAPGLALVAHKVLTMHPEGPEVVDRGTVLVRDGRIEWVGPTRECVVPEAYAVLDLGDAWLMPGMIDLHSHVGGSMDINDAVFQANPELRVKASAIPANRALQKAVAAGVTTILYIPGSATNVGGQGILMKTGFDRFERALVRDPGAMKVAQADNPVRWGYGMGRILLNWTIDEIFGRGKAYAAGRAAGVRPFDPQLEGFVPLYAGDAQVACHTQVAQVVLSTIRILKVTHGIDVFIDHGEFDAPKIASVALAEGVPAILGPRNMTSQVKSRGVDHDGRIEGLAWGYQRAGLTEIGFNTDAPVLPAEELFLQAAVAVKLGFDDDALGTVRGLTIVPARTAGIEHRVGSLSPGKDADLVAISGHPADPRSVIERVWIEGELVYDLARDGRRF